MDTTDSGIEQDNSMIYIRVSIVDEHLQKVLKFHLDETVWNAKKKVLNVLVRELPDRLNYGLYFPPCNGRAGQFLEEWRRLRDYPLSGPVCSLEFKFKRRVYRSGDVLSKKINFKMNVKKFVEALKANQTSKVARYLEKGFDPNLHLTDHETALSCACVDLFGCRSMILVLVNGGAHLDFRTREGGFTPLHLSAIHQRREAIQTLLELGASSNVFDAKNLSPLYHSILSDEKRISSSDSSSSSSIRLFLEDDSPLGCRDESLWSELHHACRLGLVREVEDLLFYRAEINALNSTGNTPLHICATTNQECCARLLLLRGANPHLVNQFNQTAAQLAFLSAHTSLGELIESHRPEDVVPFRSTPLVNPRRRSIFFSVVPSFSSRCQSMPKLSQLNLEKGTICTHPSSRSSSPKSLSDQGFNSESTSPQNTNSIVYSSKRERLYAAAPGRKGLCIKPYRSELPGELNLKKGDLVEIFSVGEEGYLEGRCEDHEGWFPTHHVQDISTFNNGSMSTEETIVISRDALAALLISSGNCNPRTIVLQRGKKGFGFVLRGSRVAGKLFHPSPSFPALQFLDSIEKNSNAEKAGLKQNDYLLEINGLNVIAMSHEECVQLIQLSGETLALKVITAQSPHSEQSSLQQQISNCSLSLPYRRKAPLRPDLSESFKVCRSSSPLAYLFSRSELSSSKRKDDSISLDDVDRPTEEEENSPVKIKPLVPERDSSLSEICRPSSLNVRRHSNCSSTEADEESSLSSLTSNRSHQSTEETNLSTFKVSKATELKRRSNHRKQTSDTRNSNNNNNNNSSPPSSRSDFQLEIEEGKDRLKKTTTPPCPLSCSSDFPPPPSPSTLRRPPVPSKGVDPRLDVNFSVVIAQRAAEAKARRHENPSKLDFRSSGLPPSTTFFNNCVTNNGIPTKILSSSPQRFSTTANQLLDNLKRRTLPKS